MLLRALGPPSVCLLLLILLPGCQFFIVCMPEPTEEHGVCDPAQQTCEEAPADPVPDTRQDGAVDIASFPPGQIPASVLLSVPNEGRLHVPEAEPPTYTYNPPASGPHFVTPAPAGFYCEPLEPGHWVHSLEHGYIVVLFDDASGCCPELRGQLNWLLFIAPPSPMFGNRKLVITPYAGLPHRICLVAWNRQLYLDEFDLARMLAFYGAYIDQGPEQEP